MKRYQQALIKKAQKLRKLGKTYSEISTILNTSIPKNTFSDWFKNIAVPSGYIDKIKQLNLTNLKKARQKAGEVNRAKRKLFLESIATKNKPIATDIQRLNTAKIALAVLCLGEASKYKPNLGKPFYLGSSDQRIITMFLELMKKCFDFNLNKTRCTVQCRADQNVEFLEEYWSKVTKIPRKYFYKALIDPRTKGKPTLLNEYKGVLRVDYFDLKVQQELESLADLVYNHLVLGR